jgi:hypothetical protein
MKKITFALLSLFALASCNKDYTCSCSFPTKPELNFDVKLESMRHNDAKVMCRDYSTFMDTTSSRDVSCELK